MVAAAIIGSSVLGAGANMIGSQNAANAQENAANQSARVQKQMYNRTRKDLLPYNRLGQQYLGRLGAQAAQQGPQALKPFTMTQDQLEQTPGYQFTMAQGLKAVQNSASARGLGVSGAAQKGAASYATGLANQTWQDQLNAYLTQQSQRFNQLTSNQQNRYNRLMGVASLGENAAAQTGAYGTQAAGNIGESLIGAGNAQAAGQIGMANALSGLGGSVGNYYAMKGMGFFQQPSSADWGGILGAG